jgi:hypothetical protein
MNDSEDGELSDDAWFGAPDLTDLTDVDQAVLHTYIHVHCHWKQHKIRTM